MIKEIIAFGALIVIVVALMNVGIAVAGNSWTFGIEKQHY